MTDKPIVAVLCDDHRPPGMSAVEATAEVRYAGAANCCRHCPALMCYSSGTSCRLQSGRPGPTWIAFDGFTSPFFWNDRDRTQQLVSKD